MAATLTDPRQRTPRWPLPDPETDDERRLSELVKEMELDRDGWRELERQAYELITGAEFCRIETTLKAVLAERPVLRGELLERVIEIVTAEHPRIRKEVAACST